MQTILITGGTGLVGKTLTGLLVEKGYDVVILSRTARISNAPGVSYAVWDVKAQHINQEAVEKADHIINLAGAGVMDKRWSEKWKKEIVESRTLSSSLIVKALTDIPNKVQSVISASAIGWYGENAGQLEFIESDAADSGFLGQTCEAWEGSISPVSDLDKRLVILRIGIVLSNDGGAFLEFKKPLKYGIATILGSGRQIISWIHIDDLCRLFIYALEQQSFSGVYNAVTPNHISNKTFIMKTAACCRGKFYIPVHVPGIALKIALGGGSVEILKSSAVSAKKLLDTGFSFSYPTVDMALKELCGSTK